MATETTATVPAGTLPYTTKLVETLVLRAVQDEFKIGSHPAIVDVSSLAAQLNVPRGMPLAGTVTIQIDDAIASWGTTNEGTAVATPTDIDPTYVAFTSPTTTSPTR